MHNSFILLTVVAILFGGGEELYNDHTNLSITLFFSVISSLNLSNIELHAYGIRFFIILSEVVVASDV